MPKICEFIDTCEFYRLTRGRKAQVWKTLLTAYCYAGFGNRCVRIAHFRNFGKWPADSVSPIGELPEPLFRLR